MKKLSLFLFLWLIVSFLLASTIDLNTATYDEIKSLPITESQAQAIYQYRQYTAFFESIYDLRKISSIDQKTLLQLRPLVSISLYTDLDETEQRREEIYFILERLGSTEGEQEGLADIWEDYLMTPRNINDMHYSDLLNMPNVSTIDAAALYRRLKAGDTITDYRNLRSTMGLANYAATNLRHYIYYQEPPDGKNLYFNYQFKYEFSSLEDDVQAMYKEVVNPDNNDTMQDLRYSYWGHFNLGSLTPAVTNKFRIRYHNNYKAGIILYNQQGENIFTDNSPTVNLDEAKYYAGYEGKFNLLGANNLKIYLGNYRVTYGEGLVIENTDYYSSRKTGHGFSKRILGINEDLSRSQEYSLKGLAVELKKSFLTTAFWFSHDEKDAIVYNINGDNVIDTQDKINGKYHVLSYVTPTIRFNNDELNEAESIFNQRLREPMKMSPRINILEEQMIGGRLEISPLVGTHLGFTGTETRYPNAHFVVPDYNIIKQTFIRSENEYRKWKKIDSQITNLYSTYKENDYEKDYRRVYGVDLRTVINNTSFQGEYAQLAVENKNTPPSALILNSYTQFDNLYFLALYRKYDLDFDNPYNRGFSEQRKFNNSIFNNNGYVLTNQLLTDLYLNSAEPQAEEGFYFETRYRFSNQLTLNRTYLDIYERVADGRRTVRFQGDLEYRPLYQLSLRGKYKHQINRYDDGAERSQSTTIEPAGLITMYLSNRDRLQVEYRYTQVKSPPYPYLTNDANASPEEPNVIGQVLMHGDLIRLDWTHNLNDRLRFRNALVYWIGNSISHWDWEDTEIDFMGEHGIKYWLLVQNKIANNVYVGFKYKLKYYRDKELVLRKWWNEDLDDRQSFFRNVQRNENEVRMQIDWRF